LITISISLSATIKQGLSELPALHQAIITFPLTKNIELIKQLATPANVNEALDNGFTPLHIAASQGNIELIEILLKNGANPTKKNYQSLTPIQIAVINKHGAALIVLQGKR
jgi:ankyrin repeat protein